MIFLGYVVRRIAVSRRTSRGTSRGSLGFFTKNFRDTTYFWIFLTCLKDLILILIPLFFSDGVTELMVCGMLYLGYAFLTSVALPFTDNSSNVTDVVLSMFISFQMLMTACLGFADAFGGENDV